MGRQHAAVGLADVASGAGAAVPGCWGEDLRGSEPPEDEGGGTVSYGERRRLPGNALVKLEVGLGLAEDVPVRQRLGSIVPTGWSAGGGDWRRA